MMSTENAKVLRQFRIEKPWYEVLRDLLQEGYVVTKMEPCCAFLRINKDVAQRISHYKEN